MIKAQDLKGHAVVDIEAAEKLGQVDEVILDPEARRVAGLVISQGQSLLNPGSKFTLPASAVHAIGPDALVVRGRPTGADPEIDHLARLPRLSQVVGLKMVSESGALLGTIDDVLIDGETGRITGYTLGSAKGGLEKLLGGGSDHRPHFVRADTDLRIGSDLIVVPDDALVSSDPADLDRLAPAEVDSRDSLRWPDAGPPDDRAAIRSRPVADPLRPQVTGLPSETGAPGDPLPTYETRVGSGRPVREIVVDRHPIDRGPSERLVDESGPVDRTPVDNSAIGHPPLDLSGPGHPAAPGLTRPAPAADLVDDQDPTERYTIGDVGRPRRNPEGFPEVR